MATSGLFFVNKLPRSHWQVSVGLRAVEAREP